MLRERHAIKANDADLIKVKEDTASLLQDMATAVDLNFQGKASVNNTLMQEYVSKISFYNFYISKMSLYIFSYNWTMFPCN